MRTCVRLWLLASLIAACNPSARRGDDPSILAEHQNPTASSILELYEDAHYKFVGHGYGPFGEDVPSFFAFNKSKNSWIRVARVSTRDAVFGRSPDFSAVPLAVGWNHSGLSGQQYVEFPLVTGAVLLPDDIEFDGETQSYLLSVGSRYGADAHPTRFRIHKRDLDAYFGDDEQPGS